MKDRRRIICTNLETRNLFTDETGTYRRLIIEEGIERLRSYDWSYVFNNYSRKWDFPGKFDTWINLNTEELIVVEEVGYQHSIPNFLRDIPENFYLLFHSATGSWVFERSEIQNRGNSKSSMFVELEPEIKLNFFKEGNIDIYELGRGIKGPSDLKIDPEVTYFDGKYFTELVEITAEEYERFKRTGQI